MHYFRKVATAADHFATCLAQWFGLRTVHFPFLVGLTGLGMSILLWRELNSQQSRRAERSLQSEVASATHQLMNGLVERSRVLTQVAHSWDRTGEEIARREVSLYTDG